MSKATTLYSPDGRSYETSSPEEVINLLARGYSETKPKTSSKSTDGK